MDATEETTGKRIVRHGSYGRHTPYTLTQHRYGSTGCEDDVQGYQEILEIKDPPPGRHPIVIHLFRNDVGSRCWEFRSRSDADAGWQDLLHRWRACADPHYLPRIAESVFAEFPGGNEPWFYDKTA